MVFDLNDGGSHVWVFLEDELEEVSGFVGDDVACWVLRGRNHVSWAHDQRFKMFFVSFGMHVEWILACQQSVKNDSESPNVVFIGVRILFTIWIIFVNLRSNENGRSTEGISQTIILLLLQLNGHSKVSYFNLNLITLIIANEYIFEGQISMNDPDIVRM